MNLKSISVGLLFGAAAASLSPLAQAQSLGLDRGAPYGNKFEFLCESATAMECGQEGRDWFRENRQAASILCPSGGMPKYPSYGVLGKWNPETQDHDLYATVTWQCYYY